MKLSNAALKVTRIKKLDEMYPAQDILEQSGQLVQYVSGIYGYHNVPLKLQQNIEKILMQELEKKGCIEVSLPILQPKEIWQESGRWDKYVSEGTMFTINSKKGEMGLAPTAEEAIVNFARGQINSYKNLPSIYYQIGDKYRQEIRTRGYLFRARAFKMMDAYSFDKDEESMGKSYVKMKQAYLKIFEKLGLEVIPVAADSGAIGGNKSEEFMVLSDIGEDMILLDEKTHKGFNIEILERPDYKEYLNKEYGITDISSLQRKRAMELGHIFQLGTKYSETMSSEYIDKDAQSHKHYMGCYGIGVSRTLAMIYERSIVRDDKGNQGIALPINIAPYLLQIVSKGEEKGRTAEALYEVLQDHNVQVIWDDREDRSIGSKLKDCKILGTPYIAILGDKTKKDEIEIEDSSTGKKKTVKITKLIAALERLNQERSYNPKSNLWNYLDEKVIIKEEMNQEDEFAL